MSKFAVMSGLGGAGAVGVVAVGVATGIIDRDRLRGVPEVAVAQPAAVAPAPEVQEPAATQQAASPNW